MGTAVPAFRNCRRALGAGRRPDINEIVSTTQPAAIITDAQRRQYQEEGYFILEGAIPEEHLQILRESCDLTWEGIADLKKRGVIG